MTEVPGKCMQCGRAVASPGLADLGDITNLTVGDVVSRGACPHCGGDVQLVRGNFNMQHGGFEMLSGPAWTLDVLEELRLTLVRIISEQPEDPISELEATHPDVAGAVRDALPGRSRREVLYALGAIVGIINGTFTVVDGVYHDIHPSTAVVQPSQPTEPTDLQRKVDELLKLAKSRGTVVPAAPRNAPCPCGSGAKYKACHGAPGMPGRDQ